jgi:hypothetical protein
LKGVGDRSNAFESQGLGKFQFYRCPERKILLKIEIQIGGQAVCIWFRKSKRTKRVTLHGSPLFLYLELTSKKRKSKSKISQTLDSH